jgi:hypothetical protein
MPTWEGMTSNHGRFDMTPIKQFLIYFLLPIIAYLSYPPGMLFQNPSIGVIILLLAIIVLFVLLGILLQRGRSSVLTLCIFLQGLNVIIRLMMLASNATVPGTGAIDWIYVITNLLGLGISFYVMLRLDRTDIRVLMTA